MAAGGGGVDNSPNWTKPSQTVGRHGQAWKGKFAPGTPMHGALLAPACIVFYLLAMNPNREPSAPLN